GMLSTGREIHGSSAGAQVHGGQVVAHLAGFIADAKAGAGIVAQADLSELVVAPAFDLAVVEARASMRAPRDGLQGGAARAQVHRRKVVAHLERAASPIDGVANAQ